MSFLIAGAVVGIGAGVAKAISGGKQKKAAKAAEEKAKAEMQKQKDAFSKLDTSNPYANMENKMDNLTVNQGEADFMKEQQQQSQANVMQQMKGAAGGSGIAALAQTMANQGSMDAQKSAISIGKQEQGNQMAERQAADQLQNKKASGEVMSRDMERNKVSTLLGMSQSDVAAQGEKVAAADSKMWSGITGAAGAAAGGLGNMNKAGMFGSTPLPEVDPSVIKMKGSPLKQADQNLVQGAYAAAGGGRQKQDGMAQGMDDLMKITSEMGADMAKNRQEAGKKGDDLAQGILDTGGALGTSWLDATRGEVEGMHGDYKTAAAFNRKGKKAKGMQDLNTLSAEIASLKDLNTQIAEWQGPPGEKSDWSNSLNAEDQGIISAFMDNNSNKRIAMVDGNRVFEVETPQGWMTSKDIEKLATDNKQDYTNMVGIRDQIIKAKESGANRSKGGPQNASDFDKTKTVAKMDNTLKNANLNSMMHDDVLENGKPFIDAIKKNPEITGMTYESLGLMEEDIVAKVDTGDGKGGGPDGIIQDNEKKTLLELGHTDMIVDALTNPKNELYNEETTRGLMANYFTLSIEKNYNDGYESNAVSLPPVEVYINSVDK